MDQKPTQPSEPQNPTPQAPSTPPAQPTTPPAGESHDAPKPEAHDTTAQSSTPPASTPVAPAANGDHGAGTPSTPPPPQSPQHPEEAHKGKSKTMLYAIITLVVVVAGALIVTFMGSTAQQPEAPQEQTVEKEQVVPPTEAPTVIPSPSTPEEQIDAVNTTDDDSDLQQVDKDLQSL